MKPLRALLWLLVVAQPFLILLLLLDREEPAVTLATGPSVDTLDAQPGTQLPPAARDVSVATRGRRAAEAPDTAPYAEAAEALGVLIWGHLRNDDGGHPDDPHLQIWAPGGGLVQQSVTVSESGRYAAALPAGLRACELHLSATGRCALIEQVEIPNGTGTFRHDVLLATSPPPTQVRLVDPSGQELTAEAILRALAALPLHRPNWLIRFHELPQNGGPQPLFNRDLTRPFDWSSGTARATLQGCAPHPRYALLFGGHVVDIQPWHPGQASLTFMLDPTELAGLLARVEVTVRDDDGAPSAGTKLHASMTATTDDTGKATLVLAPGRLNLRVEAPGRQPLYRRVTAQPGRQTKLDITVPATRRLAGRLLDPDGQPLANARLHVHSLAAQGPESGHNIVLRTGPNGAFSADVPRTPLLITVRKVVVDGTLCVSHRVDQPRGDLEGLVLRTQPAAVLRIVRPPETWRRGALLLLRDVQGSLLGIEDESGVSTFTVPPGPVTLEVHELGRAIEHHALDLTLRPHGHRLQLR